MKKLVLALLVVSQVLSLKAHAAFDEGYMSPQDMIWSLYKKFEGLKVPACQILPDPLRSALGDTSPLSGEVAVTSPNPSFLTWYTTCISSYVFAFTYAPENLPEEQAKSEVLAKKLYGVLLPKIEPLREKYPLLITSTLVSATSFDQLTKDEQKQFVANLVSWALGSDEEIQSYGFITDMNQFRADLLTYLLNETNQNMRIITEKALIVLLSRDEFLLY